MSEIDEEEHQDTVGSICIDEDGNISSGVSSGGISMKYPGRVGEAGCFGCGCWAQNEKEDDTGVGVSCTGTGEDIMLSLLANEFSKNCQTLPLDESIKESFKKVKTKEKNIGIIGLTKEKGSIDFGWAHTTQGMGIGYFSSNMKEPIALISKQEDEKNIGQECIQIVKIHRFISK